MIYLSLFPILGGVDVIGDGLSYHKLMGIEKRLSSVMGLTKLKLERKHNGKRTEGYQ
jgi:hypothetical protein